MPVFKRKYPSGKTIWRYIFSAPGATRENRRLICAVGFASKQEALDAEARRRTEELQKFELAKAGVATVAAALPTTLAMLFQEFFRQHAEEKLAPKTIERYRELATYLAPELLAMSLTEITPLHLSREWNRLLKSGGHHRKTKEARSLSAKTVRHIAGLVSSAFARAERWGLVTSNPVTRSEPPVPKKRVMKILTVGQQDTIFEMATSIWCLSMFLQLMAATASRRGEILAVRWSDIDEDGHIMIARSLTQTKDLLQFKTTKTDSRARSSCPTLCCSR
jgi:integrase